MNNMDTQFGGSDVDLAYDANDGWSAKITWIPRLIAFGETPVEALQELEIVWGMYESRLGK